MKPQSEYSNIDRQIEEILSCKPLPEAEVRMLCEKVTLAASRPRKFSSRRPTWCRCAPQS